MSRKRVLRQAMIALVIVVALVCGLALTACSGGDNTTYISLESTGISLEIGASKEITPKLESNKVKAEEISYQISLGSDVIKLEGNKVTGLKAGVAQIKVSYKTNVILIEVKVNGKDLTIEELRSLIAELDTKLIESNKTIEKIAKELEEANGAAGILGDAVDQLKAELATAQASIDKLTADLKSAMDELKGDIAQGDKAVMDKLNEQVGELDAAIKANADAINAIKDSIDAFKAADAGVAGVVKELYNEFAIYQDKKTTDYMASEWKVLEGHFYYYLSYITRSSSVEAAKGLFDEAKKDFAAVETKSQSIIRLIGNIGSTIYFIPEGVANLDNYVDSGEAIKTARSVYDSADANTQKKVPASSLNRLVNAENVYSQLQDLFGSANEVDRLIAELSSKSAEDIDAAITAANDAYKAFLAIADKLDYEIDEQEVVVVSDGVATQKYTYNYVTKKGMLDNALVAQKNANDIINVLDKNNNIFDKSEALLVDAKANIEKMNKDEQAFFDIYNTPVVSDLEANIATYNLINADFASLKDNAKVDEAIKAAVESYDKLSNDTKIANYISAKDQTKVRDLNTVSGVANLIMKIKTPIDDTSETAFNTAKKAYDEQIGSDETKKAYFGFYTFNSFDNYELAINAHKNIKEWLSVDATANIEASKALVKAIEDTYANINKSENAIAKSFVSESDLTALENLHLAAKAADAVIKMMENQKVLDAKTYVAAYKNITDTQDAIKANTNATEYFAKFSGLDKVEDIAAAVNVMDKIVAIGFVDITADELDEELYARISDARKAYNELNDTNSDILNAYIGNDMNAENYNILYNAEKDYQQLEFFVYVKNANIAVEDAMLDAQSRTTSADVKNAISVVKGETLVNIGKVTHLAYDPTYEAFKAECAAIDAAVKAGIDAMYQLLVLQSDKGTDNAYTVYAEFAADKALTADSFGGKNEIDQLTVFFSVADGDVYIEGVKVGKLIVNGGGINSVHVIDCEITDMVIARSEGAVRVSVEGKSKINTVEVSNTAILDVANAESVEKVSITSENAGVSFPNNKPVEVIIPGVETPITGAEIPKFVVSNAEQLFNAAFEATKGDIIIVNGGVYEFDAMLYLGKGTVANGDPYNAGMSFDNSGVIIRGIGEVVFTPSQKFVDNYKTYQSLKETYRMHMIQVEGNYNADPVTLENITIKNSLRAGLNLYAANASIKDMRVIFDGNGYLDADGNDKSKHYNAAIVVNQSKLVVDGVATEGNFMPFDISNGNNAQYASEVTLNGKLDFNSVENFGINYISYNMLSNGQACSVTNANEFVRTITSTSVKLCINQADIDAIKTDAFPVVAEKEGEGTLYAKDFSIANKYASKGSIITFAKSASVSDFGFSTSITGWWETSGETVLDMSFSYAAGTIDFNKLTAISYKLFDKDGKLIATALSNDKINSTVEGKTLVEQLIAVSAPYFPVDGSPLTSSIPFRFVDKETLGTCWQFSATDLKAGVALEDCYFELEMTVDGTTYKTTSNASNVAAFTTAA